MEQKKKQIVVLGSINADVFLQTDRLPQVGETVQGTGLQKAFGGKGANQAVACARLASETITCMLAQVGRDDEGRNYLEYLQKESVETKDIQQIGGVATGQAYILSYADGNNSIVIIGGANMAYPEKFNDQWKQQIEESQILLLQREIPEYVNLQAAQIAKKVGTKVILDMGGADAPLSEDLINCCDIISPNETELQRLIGVTYDQEERNIKLLQFLKQHPDLEILLKQGENGAAIVRVTDKLQELEIIHQPAFNFKDFSDLKLVDTTGAGDTFTGGFAVKSLEQGSSQVDCLKFASMAAFLCITKFGAGPAIPTRQEVDARLNKIQ